MGKAWIKVAGVVICVVKLCVALTHDWSHCTVLDGDGKYSVCWKVQEQQVWFQVEVQAHGYIGLGLSTNGGMAGSDIVTGWVKDGKTFFQDRHGVGNTLPPKDASQDWFLQSGHENDTHTTLVFRRDLQTCDSHDLPIDDSTTRLIYAYSDDDPLSDDDIQYHFDKRGTKSVLLMQQQEKEANDIDLSSLSHWDVLSPNFSLTKEFSTKYLCQIYKGPDLVGKNHIVLAKPVIEEGHEQFVHHMLLYECIGGSHGEYEALSSSSDHVCRHPNMPDAMKSCEGIFLVWAVGGENIVLPSNVGLPFQSNPTKYYMLEIHYDNSQRHDGITDNSGFRLYYTPKLREFDAGSLMVGTTVTPRVFIPPRQEEFVVAAHSSPDCLDPEVMTDSGINILGVLLHSHLLGRALKLRHFRNDSELKPLGVDNNYDFNYQEYRYFKNPLKFLPGDQMTMECIYDSSGRNTTTFGGESTEEEMCIAFLFYYPRIEIFASVSAPSLEDINTATGLGLTAEDPTWPLKLKENLTNFDWSSVDMGTVQRDLQFSMQKVHCYLGNGVKNKVKNYISYPANFREYVENENICSRQEFVRSSSGIQYEHVTFLILILYVIFFVYSKNKMLL